MEFEITGGGGVLAFVLMIVVCIVAAIVLAVNYDYRWKSACAQQRGVQMENTSGSRICVRGPVEIMTIAAKPW